MAISGLPPFPSPVWTPQKSLFPQGSVLTAPLLSNAFPAIPATLPTPNALLSTPAGGLSPVGPAVNGMVPVMRNAYSSLPAFPAASAGASPGGIPSMDTFSPSVGQFPVSSSFALPATTAGSGGANSTATSSAANRPLNSQEMGQKVGGIVSNFLQENPAVLEKLNNVDLDEIEQNVGPKVEGIRAQFQQALKKVPEGIDKRLIRMLDPGTQEIATEVDQWLRKEPEPEVLAELDAKKRAKAREEALKENAGKSRPDPLADDPFAMEDDLAGSLPPKKETYRDKLLNAKDKLVNKAQSSWPLNRNKSSLSDLEAEEPVTRPRRRPAPADDVLTDAELEALLGGFKAGGSRP